MERYEVRSIRLNKGLDRDEGEWPDGEPAFEKLQSLGDDEDCILAEVEFWREGATLLQSTIVAQSERINGAWTEISGELRARTRGGEAKDVLYDARFAAMKG
jgi:hypothetical protein